MGPVETASSLTPIASATLLSAEKKIPFFEKLHPFIQLILAIFNAAFLPSCFVFSHLFRIKTKAHYVYSQTITSGFHEIQQSQEKIPFDTEIKTEKVRIEENLKRLPHLFKQDASIMSDTQELEKLSLDIESLLGRLRGDQWKKVETADKVEIEKGCFKLQEELSSYCQREGKAILALFAKILKIFAFQIKNLPMFYRNELLEMWDTLEKVMSKETKSLSDDLEAQRKIVEKFKIHVPQKTVQVSEPVKLKDVGKNCCYLDSILQALACLDPICKELFKPLPNSTNKEKLSKIQKEILKFLSIKEVGFSSDTPQLASFLSLIESSKNPSLNRLREAIFSSQLHSDFTMAAIELQQDAAVAMEVLFDAFLPHLHVVIQEYTKADEFPGLEFTDLVPDHRTLFHVPFRGKDSIELKDFIHWMMWKHFEYDPREFDPASGIIMDPAGEKSRLISPKKVSRYVKWGCFKQLPPVMCMHLVRHNCNGKGVTFKENREVILPRDGIIDLSTYTDLPNAKYRIQSYIVHEGPSLHAGHYKAYVKYGTKYFCCDDQNKDSFVEITEKEFYERKDAYLIFMEQI